MDLCYLNCKVKSFDFRLSWGRHRGDSAARPEAVLVVVAADIDMTRYAEKIMTGS
jgi:hypothetical protein